MTTAYDSKGSLNTTIEQTDCELMLTAFKRANDAGGGELKMQLRWKLMLTFGKTCKLASANDAGTCLLSKHKRGKHVSRT